eukprot:TRINITY_DN48505_c0_g1_i1.p1 TRINITY_DN48505_c0_g1~~TRINITY_DN48505_c0_g1_i1.p1  ORF type:complete len:270 (-),score=75.53 TRINITY_DN48505_c0_g1_i1:64-816(-)
MVCRLGVAAALRLLVPFVPCGVLAVYSASQRLGLNDDLLEADQLRTPDGDYELEAQLLSGIDGMKSGKKKKQKRKQFQASQKSPALMQAPKVAASKKAPQKSPASMQAAKMSAASKKASKQPQRQQLSARQRKALMDKARQIRSEYLAGAAKDAAKIRRLEALEAQEHAKVMKLKKKMRDSNSPNVAAGLLSESTGKKRKKMEKMDDVDALLGGLAKDLSRKKSKKHRRRKRGVTSTKAWETLTSGVFDK